MSFFSRFYFSRRVVSEEIDDITVICDTYLGSYDKCADLAMIKNR